MRTWFITGGTPGGFGMAYADAALETGDRAALTARRPEQLREWAWPHGDRVLVLPLDVTDAAQVRTAVAAAEQRFDGIDVLVNNAGRGWYGSIEGMAEDAVRRTFELNFFALLSVTRAVLPGMRERRRGWILNMSSVAGLRSVIGFGYYSAAKHAAEEMIRAHGIPRAEAVARINRQWSEPDASGHVPRVWIVGLDLAYHETERYWAADIYYGHGSFWWLPDASPRPLPPP